MGWSAKQGRILTANGKAPEYYTADRGFDFDETELPHYHLIQGTTSGSSGGKKDTREIFRKWKRQDKNKSDNVENNHTLSLLIGAWKRTLFYGGWEHTTEHDENVYNLQTSTLFIDLRLPTTRLVRTDRPTVQSLHDLQAADLRRYARQHVFGGYTVMQTQQTSLPIKTEMNPRKNNKYPLTCTRHHVIDWNFVGKPRNRPNKWHVEFSHNNKQEWKEWAFATDDYRQHYYCEQWQTLLLSPSSSTSSIPVLALRKHKGHSGDGILILIDNHFNFLLDHRTLQVAAFEDDTPDTTAFASLVEIVDYHVAQENLDAARAWLSLQGGHGIVSTSDGWEIDASIEFWKENTKLFTSRDEIQVVEIEGSTETSWTEKAFVRWKGEAWEIFECNLAGPKELEELLWKGLPSGPVRSKI